MSVPHLRRCLRRSDASGRTETCPQKSPAWRVRRPGNEVQRERPDGRSKLRALPTPGKEPFHPRKSAGDPPAKRESKGFARQEMRGRENAPGGDTEIVRQIEIMQHKGSFHTLRSQVKVQKAERNGMRGSGLSQREHIQNRPIGSLHCGVSLPETKSKMQGAGDEGLTERKSLNSGFKRHKRRPRPVSRKV